MTNTEEERKKNDGKKERKMMERKRERNQSSSPSLMFGNKKGERERKVFSPRRFFSFYS